ncbi:MAG: ShlB/FhaC/HecB family hemolysin secretion/activation protein [Agarilytica sp.]
MNLQFNKITILIILLLLTGGQVSAQGFLQMPDTTEVPEFEEESMLLDLDVPPVLDRDPDPNAGPRLNVQEFRLQGVVEFPKLGITRKKLIERIEKIRFDLMKEGQLLDSGYTIDEIGEVSDLIADIEKESGEQHVGPLEVQKLVFLIREQRRSRGVTLGMIETVADTITKFYREKGFILAKAYIPEQKVRDGVVTLTLLLGELGDVTVENRKRVREGLIRNVFKHDFDAPVASWRTEENLYLVNDIPGLSAQGFFSPGVQVGDTKLTVNVLEEKWYTGNVRLDNHGSEATSENRAYLDLKIHNPFGIGDELYIALLQSYNPDASTYWSVRYQAFVGSPRVRLEAGFSTNDFVSRDIRGVSDDLFTGESEVADIKASYIFKRSRVRNSSMYLGYMDIATKLDTNNLIEESSKKYSLGYSFDVLNQKKRQLYIGNVSMSNAKVDSTDAVLGAEGNDGSGSESMANFDFSVLSFVKLPFTNVDTRVVYKGLGQYSGATLSNINQISLSGPGTTRAFGINGFQADDGLYLGVDWFFSFPNFGDIKLFGESLSRVFKPYLFADYSFGLLQPPEGSEEGVSTGKLANYGAGLSMDISSFSASLFGASPIIDKVADREDQTPTSNFYFELQYTF